MHYWLWRTAAMKSSRHRVIDAGPVSLDESARTVYVDGREVSLTRTEFDLLHTLILEAGGIVWRQDILSAVWGGGRAAGSRCLDRCVRHLRQKLERDPRHPKLIQTVQGAGYRFDSSERALGEV
jgi:DNA-binding response OmpR family regulator